MKININPDKEFVNDMRRALKDNILTDMPRTATSPTYGFGMSRPEAALMKSISATHNNKTHFTRNASSLYGAFFPFSRR